MAFNTDGFPSFIAALAQKPVAEASVVITVKTLMTEAEAMAF